MAKLVLSMDGLVLKEIGLMKERTTIGRKPHNDVQIDNLAVSGEHAVIVTILNDSFLEDLGSTNGTLVNGQPIKKHFLQSNDVIELGKYKLKYVIESASGHRSQEFEKTMVLKPMPAKLEAGAQTPDLHSSQMLSTSQPLRTLAPGKSLAAASAGAAEKRPLEIEGAPAGDPSVTAPIGLAGLALEPKSARELGLVATELQPSSTLPPLPGQSLAGAGSSDAPGSTASMLTRSNPVVTDASSGRLETAPQPAQIATIQILTGSNAGRELEIVKTLTTLGKPRVQIAVITKRPQGYYITHVEGTQHPIVNGKTTDAHPHPLQDHDVIEIAGVKMEFYFKS